MYKDYEKTKNLNKQIEKLNNLNKNLNNEATNLIKETNILIEKNKLLKYKIDYMNSTKNYKENYKNELKYMKQATKVISIPCVIINITILLIAIIFKSLNFLVNESTFIGIVTSTLLATPLISGGHFLFNYFNFKSYLRKINLEQLNKDINKANKELKNNKQLINKNGKKLKKIRESKCNIISKIQLIENLKAYIIKELNQGVICNKTLKEEKINKQKVLKFR